MGVVLIIPGLIWHSIWDGQHHDRVFLPRRRAYLPGWSWHFSRRSPGRDPAVMGLADHGVTRSRAKYRRFPHLPASKSGPMP
jgi:hypothetical protein